MSDNTEWTLSINKKKLKSFFAKAGYLGKEFTKGVLLTLPFVLVGALIGLFATFNHLNEKARESFILAPDTQAEALASGSEQFSMWGQYLSDEVRSPEVSLDRLKNNVLYTPSGGDWVWWAIYYGQALSHRINDGVEVDHVSFDQIARQALNRLEGRDLLEFIGVLGETMPDHTYPSNFPEKLKIPAEYNLNFTHQEMSIIRECERQLRSQYEASTWSYIHYTGDLAFGRLWPQPCNLRARIALEVPTATTN